MKDIHEAARRGDAEEIRSCLSAGIAVDLPEKQTGQTALIIACISPAGGGYPEEIFPPTDFHSATLVDEWIYIIGNLGYPAARGSETPVYRLHTDTGRIEKVLTEGQTPGWIHSHQATLENGKIRIAGGKLHLEHESGERVIQERTESHWFDPVTASWQQVQPSG